MAKEYYDILHDLSAADINYSRYYCIDEFFYIVFDNLNPNNNNYLDVANDLKKKLSIIFINVDYFHTYNTFAVNMNEQVGTRNTHTEERPVRKIGSGRIKKEDYDFQL